MTFYVNIIYCITNLTLIISLIYVLRLKILVDRDLILMYMHHLIMFYSVCVYVCMSAVGDYLIWIFLLLSLPYMDIYLYCLYVLTITPFFSCITLYGHILSSYTTYTKF